MEFRHEYLISSERAWRRDDEKLNKLQTNCVYEEGDIIVLDGIRWVVDKVIR